MVKESSTSSTAKKKKTTKKKTTTKTVTKKTAAAKKAKTPAKKTKTPAKKTKTAAKKPPKKLSLKDILFLKFEPWKPEALFSVPPKDMEKEKFTAPSFFEGKSDEEIKELRELLVQKFDYAAIIEEGIAAMKAEEARIKAEEEARIKAEEEARIKAEEEARIKAEEEARKKAEEEARKKAEEEARLQEMMRKAEEARLAEAARKAEQERLANLTTREKLSIAMEESKPMNKTMIYAGAFFAFIFAVLIFASASNMNNYYLKTTDKGVEIWQGKFAPLGKKLIISMPGVKAPETIKACYTKDEVFPLAFQYHVDSSERILDAPGIPNFKAIKAELNEALDYATTNQHKQVVTNRLAAIDLTILMYKADVFASNGTAAGLQKALDYLGEATALPLTEAQTELVEQKIQMYKNAAVAAAAETGEEADVSKLYSWKNVRRQVAEQAPKSEMAQPAEEAVSKEPAEVPPAEEAVEKIEKAEEGHETAIETHHETPAAHH